MGGAVFAQEKAEITPESPFYFIDITGEVLEELLTFNPESKARLQVKFAGERIEEIKVILKTKGAGAKGLTVAQARLEKQAKKAADIVEKEKQKGNDVSTLAGEIVDNFHIQRIAAKQAFDDAKQEFLTKKGELHNQLLAAIEAGDTALQEQIRAEFATVEAAKDEVEAKKDETITTLEEEKDRLQDELEEQKRLEDEARDAAEEAEDAKKEAEEKQKELEEKTEEAAAEAQEKLNEADKEKAERMREEAKREEEKLKKEQEQTKEEQKRAEEKQREAEEKLRELEEKESE